MRCNYEEIIIFIFVLGLVRESMADDIVLEPKLIAREYLRKWFTLDIVSCLPLDYILLAFDNGTEQIAQAGVLSISLYHYLTSKRTLIFIQ